MHVALMLVGLVVPYPPAELRAKYWKAANNVAEWQAKLYQAQLALTGAGPELQKAVAELKLDCEKRDMVLSEDKDREPICIAKTDTKK